MYKIPNAGSSIKHTTFFRRFSCVIGEEVYKLSACIWGQRPVWCR